MFLCCFTSGSNFSPSFQAGEVHGRGVGVARGQKGHGRIDDGVHQGAQQHRGLELPPAGEEDQEEPGHETQIGHLGKFHRAQGHSGNIIGDSNILESGCGSWEHSYMFFFF